MPRQGPNSYEGLWIVHFIFNSTFLLQHFCVRGGIEGRGLKNRKPAEKSAGKLNGAEGQNRTADTGIPSANLLNLNVLLPKTPPFEF
jgi:hypothetical protein